VSKRASPARFGQARFWPVLNGAGRAGPNGKMGCVSEPGPRAGGLAGRPASFFSSV